MKSAFDFSKITNMLAGQIDAFRNDSKSLKELQWNIDILREEGPEYMDLYNTVLCQLEELTEDGIIDVDDLLDICNC